MRVGRPFVLTEAEENSIVDHMLVVSKWGFPLDMTDLRYMVKAYLDSSEKVVSRFCNNYPGYEWAVSFMQRCKAKVSQRPVQDISMKQSKVTPNTVNTFFENYEKTQQMRKL